MQITEARFHLGSVDLTGCTPVIFPFPFPAQARCRTICCATSSDSARQRLAEEAASVNSRLRAWYHLRPEFL